MKGGGNEMGQGSLVYMIKPGLLKSGLAIERMLLMTVEPIAS